MSKRLTKKWTKTAEQAFGKSGKKGRIGELFIINMLKKWNWEVKDLEADNQAQRSGIDIKFKPKEVEKWWTGDIKNNLTNSGVFFVHMNWLFKSKADKIFHVNPKTQIIAWYTPKHMQKYFKQNINLAKSTDDGFDQWIMIDIRKLPSFVVTREMKGKYAIQES